MNHLELLREYHRWLNTDAQRARQARKLRAKKPRSQAIIHGNTACIQLVNNKGTLILDANCPTLDLLLQHRIYRHSKGYAAIVVRINGKSRTLLVHNLVGLDIPDGKQVDHLDGNKLDCRRQNLAIVTSSGNNLNRSTWGRSPYRGVAWDARRRRWLATYQRKDAKKLIGTFDNQVDAAIAWDRYLIRNDLPGLLNFPDTGLRGVA